MPRFTGLFLVICFFASSLLTAQNKQNFLFRLQDGSELRGQVLSVTEEEGTLVLLVSGQEVWIANEDMLYNGATKERYPKQTTDKKKKVKPRLSKLKGWKISVTTGMSMFLRDGTFFLPTVGMGYALEGSLFYPLAGGRTTLGINTGIQNYYFAGREVLVPVFGEMRARFSQKTRGYFLLGGGYGFSVADLQAGIESSKGGPFGTVGFGGYFEHKNAPMGYWDIGYRYQQAYFMTNPPNGGDLKSKEIQYNRIHFRVGVILGK
ncbi:MAG: hypothetical protein AAGH79_04130 [Bacteroidota bacterium]